MKVIIDRFEGEYAVIETDTGVARLSRSLVPQAKEGDALCITVDPAETEKRRQAVQSLMDDLFAD